MQVMNINQTTPQSQSFKGRYILNGDEKVFAKLKDEVLMRIGQQCSRKTVAALQIDDVYRRTFLSFADSLAQHLGYSRSWLLQNAKNHNLELNLDRKNEIIVMTGNDVVDLLKYIKKDVGEKEKFKRFLTLFKIQWKYKSLPPYLRELCFANSTKTTAEQKFYDFVNQKQCEKLNSIEDLANKIFSEK